MIKKTIVVPVDAFNVLECGSNKMNYRAELNGKPIKTEYSPDELARLNAWADKKIDSNPGDMEIYDFGDTFEAVTRVPGFEGKKVSCVKVELVWGRER